MQSVLYPQIHNFDLSMQSLMVEPSSCLRKEAILEKSFLIQQQAACTMNLATVDFRYIANVSVSNISFWYLLIQYLIHPISYHVEMFCFLVFTVGKEWYRSTTLQDNPGESDVGIAHTLYNRYLASTQLTSGLASFNITLNLDTNHVRGFLFNARAKLTWPRVTKPEINMFPLTQVGNFSYKDILLINPSDKKIYFHLVPLSVYPDGIKVVNLLPAW